MRTPHQTMAILELCAGYGGLGMAVEALTGDKVTWVADNDAAASAVLSVRYPEAPNLGDITKIDWYQFPGTVDIITAGFPCQDISNAGPREGIKGGRSSLWFEIAEAIRILRPRLAYLENVGAIRNRGLGVVLSSLHEIGYDAKWGTLRASSIGAPHHRERWFCIASPSDANGV